MAAMAFGERIKPFRIMRGLKRRQAGEPLGFNGAATEVRMAQYENEKRVRSHGADPVGCAAAPDPGFDTIRVCSSCLMCSS